MAVDPAVARAIRDSELEVALYRARLECASPSERTRMQAELAKRISHRANGASGSSSEPEMTDEEFSAWWETVKHEEPDPEYVAVLQEAQAAARAEVERRRRAGTLMAS